MKKTSSLIILAAMILAVAGNAAAVMVDPFAKGTLTAVATDYASKNVGYGLGEVTNPLYEPIVSLSSFASSTSWDKVRVAMFGAIWNEEAEDIRFWFTLNKSTTPSVSSSALDSFNGADTTLKNLFAARNPWQQVSPILNTELKSYDVVMSSNSNARGFYAGLNNILADGEVDLSSFAGAGLQTAKAYLYQYRLNFTTGELDLVPGSGGNPYQRIVTIYEGAAAGVQAVPIPGAVYLLATGLVGLVGLRRRMK